MEIKTERLIIKDLSLDDVERFSEYRNKKEVAEYQSWDHYSIQKAKQRILYCLKHPFQGKIGNYHLGIYLNNYLIGDIFIEIDGYTTFTIGYTLDSLYWAKGYASEAIQAFLEHMRDIYHFKICLAHVYDDNVRSIHLLEKMGFDYVNKSWFYQDILYKKRLD
ncbi:MAG: GNAT family N-acetyltransferase [Faecalibacillus sp.]